MARIFMTGWEMGSIDCMTPVGTPDLVSTGQRTGTYALRFNADSEGATISLGGSKTEVFTRIAIKVTSTPSNGATIIGFFSVTGGITYIGMPPWSQTLTVWQVNAATDTVIASGPALVLNTWYVIEVRYKPHATVGVIQVKIDGNLVIDYSGAVTGYGGTSLTNLGLGKTSAEAAGNSEPVWGIYDDFAVNDTTGSVNNSWCGRGGIEGIFVTGVGTTTQLTPSAGDNWDCVEERPPSDADYVGAQTVDLYDTYAMSNCVQSGGVPAVCAWLRAALSEAGAGNVAPVIRTGGADQTGSDKGIDTTFRYVNQIYETVPGTSNPWTTALVDAVECGPKAR